MKWDKVGRGGLNILNGIESFYILWLGKMKLLKSKFDSENYIFFQVSCWFQFKHEFSDVYYVNKHNLRISLAHNYFDIKIYVNNLDILTQEKLSLKIQCLDHANSLFEMSFKNLKENA